MNLAPTPYTVQNLGGGFHGYSDWSTFAVRDARNVALAEIGHIDRSSAVHAKSLAALFAAAPALLMALNRLQANPNDPCAHREALDAINLATKD
jgi:hypothetical protein